MIKFEEIVDAIQNNDVVYLFIPNGKYKGTWGKAVYENGKLKVTPENGRKMPFDERNYRYNAKFVRGCVKYPIATSKEEIDELTIAHTCEDWFGNKLEVGDSVYAVKGQFQHFGHILKIQNGLVYIKSVKWSYNKQMYGKLEQKEYYDFKPEQCVKINKNDAVAYLLRGNIND